MTGVGENLKILNERIYAVDRLNRVESKVLNFFLLISYLLRSYFTVGVKKVSEDPAERTTNSVGCRVAETLKVDFV